MTQQNIKKYRRDRKDEEQKYLMWNIFRLLIKNTIFAIPVAFDFIRRHFLRSYSIEKQDIKAAVLRRIGQSPHGRKFSDEVQAIHTAKKGSGILGASGISSTFFATKSSKEANLKKTTTHVMDFEDLQEYFNDKSSFASYRINSGRHLFNTIMTVRSTLWMIYELQTLTEQQRVELIKKIAEMVKQKGNLNGFSRAESELYDTLNEINTENLSTKEIQDIMKKIENFLKDQGTIERQNDNDYPILDILEECIVRVTDTLELKRVNSFHEQK